MEWPSNRKETYIFRYVKSEGPSHWLRGFPQKERRHKVSAVLGRVVRAAQPRPLIQIHTGEEIATQPGIIIGH